MRRDKTASWLENLSVPADYVRAVDEIEDSLDAVRVRPVQRIDNVDGFGVVDFFSTKAASFVGVASNRRDDVRAAVARHLHRIAADPAGGAHHNQALACGDAQQLERTECGYCRDGKCGCLFVSNTIRDTRQGLCLHARCNRGIFGVRAVRRRHAKDAFAGVEIAFSRRNAFDHTREVFAKDNRICRGGRLAWQGCVVDGIHPGILHAYKERAVRSRAAGKS